MWLKVNRDAVVVDDVHIMEMVQESSLGGVGAGERVLDAEGDFAVRGGSGNVEGNASDEEGEIDGGSICSRHGRSHDVSFC